MAIQRHYNVVGERTAVHLGSEEGADQRRQAWRLFRGSDDGVSDEEALLIDDPDHSDVEGRFLLLGLSARIRLVTVCHCVREDEITIRLISARKATKREQNQYVLRYRR